MHLELFASHLSRQASLYCILCILCMTQLFQCQSGNFFANKVILNLAAGTCAVPRLNLVVGQAGLDPALVSDVGRK